MNQKQIGIIVIIIGLLLSGFVYTFKQQADYAATQVLEETGSCITEQGCLHEKNNNLFLTGIGISTVLLALGGYLVFFDKTQQQLAEHQIKVTSALKEAKQKDEFGAFLVGFKEDEQKVLKAIRNQDGIKQSTLRYRADISKTALSLLIKSLEERKIVYRKPDGKTYQVFLKKQF